MALDIVTQANLIVDQIAPIALGKLIAELNFVSTTRNWPDPIQSDENSNVYRVPKLGSFSANTRAPGADVTYQDPAATKEDITVQEFETSFLVDASLEASQGVRYLNQFIDEAVKTIAEEIETVSMANVAAGATNFTGAFGTAFDEARLRAARLAMGKDKIPRTERYLALAPDAMAELTAIDKFSRADILGVPGVNLEGFIGRVLGFNTWESPYVDDGGGTDLSNVAYWRNAIMHIFPRQVDFAEGSSMKRSFERDGIRISVLRERVSGKNGGIGYTISSVYGNKIVRQEGVQIVRSLET